jgi:hypothetical protein
MENIGRLGACNHHTLLSFQLVSKEISSTIDLAVILLQKAIKRGLGW